jgi:uncharacterized phage-associated protein
MHFEAWDYGPVIPAVYRECKAYGNGPVRQAFLLSRPFEAGTDERSIIEEVYNVLKDKSAAQLVAMTHIRNGAWANSYMSGHTGMIISDQEIRNEYQWLTQ